MAVTEHDFCHNCSEVWALCQCEYPSRTYPELVSLLRKKIKALSSEADDEVRSLSAHVQSLDAKCAELERDAARYRWLRSNCQYGFEDHDGPQLVHRNKETGPCQNPRWREDLDTAIDAAMSAQSDTLRPPKPAECAVKCPPQQVCDHCQWPSRGGDEERDGR